MNLNLTHPCFLFVSPQTLMDAGAMDYTTIVAATASDAAPLQVTADLV